MPLHLRATKLKFYKWWSERKFSSYIHFLTLVVYVTSIIIGNSSLFLQKTLAAALVKEEIVFSDTSLDIYLYDLATLSEKELVKSGHDQISPYIHDQYVVYVDQSDGVDIFLKNISTGESVNVSNSPHKYKEKPIIFDNRIAWVDYDQNSSNIYMATISEQGNIESVVNVTPNTDDSFQYSPAINERYLAWHDNRGDNGFDIYFVDFLDPDFINKPTLLTENSQGFNSYNPSLSENKIVWEDDRNGYSDIYFAELDNPATFINPINLTPDTQDTFQQNVSIYENFVTWRDDRSGSQDIYLLNLNNPDDYSNITSEIDGNSERPVIYQNLISWELNDSDGSRIFYYNVLTEKINKINYWQGHQSNPRIFDGKIVFEQRSISPYGIKTDGEWTVFFDSSICSIYAFKSSSEEMEKISNECNEFYVSEGLVLILEHDDETGRQQYFLLNLNDGIKRKITNDDIERRSVFYSKGKMVWVQGDPVKEIYYSEIGENIVFNPEFLWSYDTMPGYSFDISNTKISGNYVVWNMSILHDGNYSHGIDSLEIEKDKIIFDALVDRVPGVYYSEVSVSEEGVAAWYDNSSGENEIYVKKIRSSSEKTKITNINDQYSLDRPPIIDDNRVFWSDDRSGYWNLYLANITDLNNIQNFSISPQESEQNDFYVSGSKIIWRDYRRGFLSIYLGDVDSVGPAFENLPSTNKKINFNQNEIIRKSPVPIKVRPVDKDNDVAFVSFYLSGELIESVSTPDSNGIYETSLNMNVQNHLPGGVNLRAVAYDTLGNANDIEVKIVPDPLFFPYLNVSVISENSENASNLLVSEEFIVWSDARNGNNDIYAATFDSDNTLKEFSVFEGPGSQEPFKLENNVLIWIDYDGNGSDFYISDLRKTNQIENIPVGVSNENDNPLFLIGERIIWQSGDYPQSKLFLTDFSNTQDIKTIQLDGLGGTIFDIYQNMILLTPSLAEGVLRVINVEDIADIKIAEISNNYDASISPKINNNFVAWKDFESKILLSDYSDFNNIVTYPLSEGGPGLSLNDFFGNNLAWNAGLGSFGYNSDLRVTNFSNPGMPHTTVISDFNKNPFYGGSYENKIYWLEENENGKVLRAAEVLSGGDVNYEDDIIENSDYLRISATFGQKVIITSGSEQSVYLYDLEASSLQKILTGNGNSISDFDLNNNFVSAHYHFSESGKCYPVVIDLKSLIAKAMVTGTKDSDRNEDGPYLFKDGVVFIDGLDKRTYYSSLKSVDIFSPEFFHLEPLTGTTGDETNFIATAWDNDVPSRAQISLDGQSFMEMSRKNVWASEIGYSSSFVKKMILPPNKLTLNYVLKFFDLSGNVGLKSGVIAVSDNDKPKIISVRPLIGTTGDPLNLKIIATDNIGITRYQLSLYRGAYFDIPGANYYLTIPSNSLQPISLKTKISDAAGNSRESTEYSIKILDNDPPEIVSVTNGQDVTKESPIITVEAKDNISLKKAIISFDGIVWESMSGNDSPFTYKFNFDMSSIKNSSNFFVRVYDGSNNYVERDSDGNIKTVIDERNIPKEDDVMEGASEDSSFKNIRDRVEKIILKITEEVGNSLNNAVKASLNLGSMIVGVAQGTPASLAYSFPYLLFFLLAAFFYRISLGFKKEIEYSRKLLELIESQKIIAEDKENFIALSSHYLRTPLTIIKGGLESLDKKNDNAGKLYLLVKNLSEEIGKITNSIENSKYLSDIKKPNLKKEKLKRYSAVSIWLPLLLVIILVLLSNFIFVNLGIISNNLINILIQILLFAIVLQLIYSFFRNHRNKIESRREFKMTISYEKKIDKERDRFMNKAIKKLSVQLRKIKEELKKLESKNHEAVEAINEGLKRFNQLLLRIAMLRVVNLKSIRKKSKVNLRNILENILKVKNFEIEKNKISVSITGKDLIFNQNVEIISFILDAIIDNAIKFNKPNGNIKIQYFAKNDLIRVIVSDSGIGINKEGIKHLFKPFTRAESVLDFDYEGYGLSLYLSKIMIKRLGGDIEIKSKKNKGTRVEISFNA